MTIPSDPREWRPQRAQAVRGTPWIETPVVEPIWSGRRVLAFYREAERQDEWGTVEAIDADGGDPTPDALRAFDQLRRSVLAREAIIDAIVTDQAIDADTDRIRMNAGDKAVVCLDVLRLDGQNLFDVPLLERKRLLDSLIDQSALVRVTPWVRPPYRSYFVAWRSQGFEGVMLKAANSRYTPGAATTEWASVTRAPVF